MKRAMAMAMAGGMLLLSALVVAQSQPAGPPASAPAGGDVELTFLHVNDVHGTTQGMTLGSEAVGGYARLKTAVEEVRAASRSARVFLCHCGDEFSRGDELTVATRGAANIALMNHLAFDFFTPGNGDHYDWAAGDGRVDGIKNLQSRIGEGAFTTLASNVTFGAGGKATGETSAIVQAGPVKVAFLGLCFVRMANGAKALKLEAPTQTAERLVPALRRQADVVVAMTHIGHGQDRELASAVAGIDLVLGGHSHTTLPNGARVRGPDKKETLICQAGDQLRFLGQVKLTLKKGPDGRYAIASSIAELIPLDMKVRQDPKVKALIAKLAAKPVSRPASQPAGIGR